MRVIDITGQRFGRTVAIREAPSSARGARFLCRCDCGVEHVAHSADLRSGHSSSCGCLRREVHLTHGGAHTPEWDIWRSMRQRCKPGGHPNYGGRGIRVCARWQKFANFIADMGPRPSPELTVERKNNDGNYEPNNCVWATRKEQANNTRRSIAARKRRAS